MLQLLPRRNGLKACLLAAVVLALALALRLAVAPVNAGLQYLTFFPAVTVAAMLGGALPGLLVTLCGMALASFIFTPPYYTVSLAALQASLWSNLVFFVDGLTLCWAVHSFERNRAQSLAASALHAQELHARDQAHIAALHQAAENTRLLVKHAPMCMAMFDTALCYLAVSDQWLAEFEQQGAAELRGRALASVHPQLAERCQPLCQRGLAGAVATECTETVVQPDGGLRWLSWAAHPWYAEGGTQGGIILSMQDVSARTLAEQDIRRRAHHDPLTSLPNRHLLMDRLVEAHAEAARNSTPTAVLFIDLDNFKQLNDGHGHQVGDMLLREVAVRLQNCVRDGDTVARFGGDEFLVLLRTPPVADSTLSRHAAQVSERILAALAHPYPIGGALFHITCSIGVAVLNETSVSAESVIRQADLAMYEAKAQGRASVRFFAAPG